MKKTGIPILCCAFLLFSCTNKTDLNVPSTEQEKQSLEWKEAFFADKPNELSVPVGEENAYALALLMHKAITESQIDIPNQVQKETSKLFDGDNDLLVAESVANIKYV